MGSRLSKFDVQLLSFLGLFAFYAFNTSIELIDRYFVSFMVRNETEISPLRFDFGNGEP